MARVDPERDPRARVPHQAFLQTRMGGIHFISELRIVPLMLQRIFLEVRIEYLDQRKLHGMQFVGIYSCM